MRGSEKEYIDIHIKIEDTPVHLFEKLTTYTFPEGALAIGLDLVSKLDAAIRIPDNQQQLYSLYFNYYEAANTTKMEDKEWPASFEIEKEYDDVEFNSKVQNVYNELVYRKRFDRLKHCGKEKEDEFLEVADRAWETYESILQREYREITFPAIIVWEILENFCYQFTQYHNIKQGISKKQRLEDHVFNIQTAQKKLGKLIDQIPKEYSKNVNTREIFAYYSLVIRANIEAYLGNYREALKIISRISLQDLAVYSKSLGCLLDLFLTASYSYFILQHYKESARLGEMFIIFYQKNKKYFAGAANQRNITRQYQKLVGILCLNYVFLEEKPKNVIMEVFKNVTIKVKDKQYREKISDKYLKLKQNDLGTFSRLLNHCSLPLIHSASNLTQQQETVLNRFKKLNTVTINTILQHYTQISLSKMAKMLNATEEDVQSRLQSFTVSEIGSTPWEKTILEPLLIHTRQIHVQITEDNIVKLDTDETNAAEGFNEWEQYKKEISWLVEKVNAL